LNILLQILDDGRITDSHGKEVKFDNCVIVMTTNAGSTGVANTAGFGNSTATIAENRTEKALLEFLRPEFINRVDEIITFNHLTEENFVGIADIMLKELRESLAARELELTIDPSVREYLVKKAFSVTYGARNLRREIQRSLEDPISEKIIDSFEHPISSISITVENEEIVVNAQ
jgi:ATP-dependent Clp protease ATP-binding subunit ClpA